MQVREPARDANCRQSFCAGRSGGCCISARTELLKSLQLIAQALDAQEASTVAFRRAGRGLTALEEACEFCTPPLGPAKRRTSPMNCGHRIARPCCSRFESMSISPIVAQQQYFGLAQAQLTLAAGGLPARIANPLPPGPIANGPGDPRCRSACAARTASAGVSPGGSGDRSGNWLAANELGVLLARYGQLPEARQLLVHSVTVHPHLEGWHNLSVVHRRLGEADLARGPKTNGSCSPSKRARRGPIEPDGAVG